MAADDRKDDVDTKQTPCDETAGVMVYGNLKIRDPDSGEMLVNKRA
jgi:hypothetical protein